MTNRVNLSCSGIVLWLVVLVISMAIQACATGGGNAQEGGNVVVLKKADSGKEIQVKKGDVLQIELEGTGGTGYWWYVTERDPRLLELLSEETKVPSEKKLGGPVTGVWRLKAIAAGKTRLVMKYYRVWEGPDKAAEQFSVVLTVE